MAIFDNISEDEQKAMIRCMGGYIHTYTKGEYILLEDDEVNYLGIVQSGQVEMIKEDMFGNRTILTMIKKGELFGETFICANLDKTIVSFKALSETKVLLLPFNKVLRTCSLTCKFHHRLVENMVQALAEKNVQLMKKINILSRKALREKIMIFLTEQSIRAESYSFEIPLGRIQMSEYLGVDRSALTRELNAMVEEGVITFEKRQFTILEPIHEIETLTYY